MELRRQIAIIRTWFPLLILSAALGGGAAFVASSQQQPIYEAKATLIVGQSLSAVNPDFNQLLASQRLSTTYASVATTRPILESVVKKLGLTVTGDQLRGSVFADTPSDNSLLTLTARDPDPGRAAAIANAVAEELIAVSPAIQGRQAEFQASIDADLLATQEQIDTTQARVDTLSRLASRTTEEEAELSTLEGRLASLRSTYAALLSYASGSGSSLLSIVEPAVPSTSPVSPKTLLNTLLGTIVGLLLGAAIVFLIEYFDDRVKDPEMAQEATGLSTLGTIANMEGDQGRGEMYRLATLLYPRSSIAEAYRTLRTNVEFASVDTPLRTLLVTSSVPGEGKTVTASNLAIVFAQAGRRVLLVDADLRKPGVHIVFDLSNAWGLTTLLRSDDARLDAVAQATEQENLRILSTGPLPPNPAELLGSERMRHLVESLVATSDLVIFDSPPLGAVADAAILSSLVDGTLFVVDARRSRRGSVRQSREALAKAGARVLGTVVNRTRSRTVAGFEGYYGAAYGTETGRENVVTVADTPRSTSGF